MATERLQSLTHLVAVLTRGHRWSGLDPDGPPSPRAVDLLSHSLQAAHEAYLLRPGDDGLQVAALVHDIGLLVISPNVVGPVDHARIGAHAVAALLGRRVERLVELHVEAKRYLASTDRLFWTSMSSEAHEALIEQGGPMSPEERASFMQFPEAGDGLLLAAADQRAWVPGRPVPSLVSWIPVITTVIATAGASTATAGTPIGAA